MAAHLVMLRKRDGDEYELIGKISDYVHPDERHCERMSQIRRLRRKIETAAEGMAHKTGQTCARAANQSPGEESARERMRRWTMIHTRRLLELQSFAIELSHELKIRGI